MLLKNNPLLQYHLPAALVVSFILRMSFPAVRYVFYPLFAGMLIYHLVVARDYHAMGKILKHQLFFLILLGIFIAAAVFHTPFIRPWIEIANALEMLVIIVMIFYWVRTPQDFKALKARFFQQIFGVALVMALVGLGKLVMAIIKGDVDTSPGESLISTASDYNFYVLTLLYGLVLGGYHMLGRKGESRRQLLFTNAAMLVFAFNIALVPSRRGMVVFLLLLAVLLVARIAGELVHHRRSLRRVRRLDYFLVIVLVGILGMGLFFQFTSPGFKKKLLISSGLYKIDLRSRITNLYCRYGRLVKPELDFRGAYFSLWRSGGERGHGQGGRHEPSGFLVDQSFRDGMGDFRVKGNPRTDILPEGNPGPGMLAIRAATSGEGVSRRFYADVGDTIHVSAWVKVLEWSPALRMCIPDRDNHQPACARPPAQWEGDGQWHRLEMEVVYDVFGSLPLWIGGGGPQPSPSFSCWSGIRVRGGRGHRYGDQANEKILPHQLPEISGEHIKRAFAPRLVESDGPPQDMETQPANPSDGQLISIPSRLKQTLVKKEANLPIDTAWLADAPGNYQDNRIDRWRLATRIYQHYNNRQKIFGAGLSWLPLYGQVFYSDPRYYDYPHNPMISTLLYSGALGAVLYLAFLARALVLFIRYRSKHPLLLALFLLTGVFVAVSGNSHFSVPAFVLFTNLPFLFAYIEGKTLKLLR